MSTVNEILGYDPAGMSDESSFISDVGDFVTYGLSSAALSAGISFANTGIALGNSLGGDFNEISTEETIRGLGMDATADYYSEHKTALDAIGFMAGSLVPGIAGVKALKAAQGALGTSARLSTGLRKALIPSSAVGTIRTALHQGGVNAATASLKTNTLKLIREGFHQQALEAAAFEGAVLLTMNQSPVLDQTSLDGEDLDYFDGIANNLDHAAAGLVFGGLIGGTFASTKLIGSMKNMIKESDLQEKALRYVLTEGEKTGIGNGDAFMAPLSSYIDTRIQMSDDTFKSLTPGQQKDVARKLEVARGNMEKIIAKMTNGDEELSQQMMDFFSSEKITDLTSGANYASGVRGYSRIKEADYVFDEQVGAIDFMAPEDVVPFVRGLYKEGGVSLGGALSRRIEDYTDPELYELLVQGNNGFTFPRGQLNNKGVKGVSIVKDTNLDEMFTFRHEVGHNRSHFFTSSVVTNSKRGVLLRHEAVQLSRQARPGLWQTVDRINAGIEAGIPLTKAQQKHLDYMYSSDELLADSYAMLSNPEKYKEMRQLGPNVFKLMYRNRALKNQLAGGRQIVRLVDGELVEHNVLPTAADLGPVSVKNGVVSYGDRVKPLEVKFTERTVVEMLDSGDWDPSDFNALYAASKVRQDIYDGMKIDFYDLPKLTAALAQGKTVNVVRGTDDAIAKFGSLENALLEAKVEIGLQLLKKEQLVHAKQGFSNISDARSYAQIGQIIDTGEEFVKKLTLYPIGKSKGYDLINSPYLSKELDIPFWSSREGFDPTKPYYAKVLPDRNAIKFNELGAFRAAGEADTLQRVKLQRWQIEKVFNAFAKSDAEQLEPSAFQSNVNAALNVSPTDSSSGYFTSANADYLSGMQAFQLMGGVTRRIESRLHTELDTFMGPHAAKAMSDPESLYEFAALASSIRQTTGQNGFTFMENSLEEFLGKTLPTNLSVDERTLLEEIMGNNLQVLKSTNILDTLFPKGVDNVSNGTKEFTNRIWLEGMRDDFFNLITREYDSLEDHIAAINRFNDQLKSSMHTIRNKPVNQFLRNLVAYNDAEVIPHKQALSAAVGGGARLRQGVIYIGPISPTRFKHHAMVVPVEQGLYDSMDVGMIVGHDPAALQLKMDRVKATFGDKVKIVTNKDIADYKKFLNEYESDKLFRKSNMDVELIRKGIFWDVTPEPDARSVLDVLDNYKRQQSGLTRSMMEAKYSEEFGAARQFSDEFDRLNSPSGQTVPIRNAYKDAINLALNKRPDDPGSLWNQLNTITENKVSEAWYKLRGALRPAQATGNWEKMNEYMESFGLPKMYSEANQLFLMNVDAPEAVLGGLTSKMNAFLGTTMLRMDSTQAVVNAVSLPINMVSEFQALQKVVSADRWEVLRNGTSVLIPGMDSAKNMHLAPMMYKAVDNFFKQKNLLKEYTERGLINTVMQDIAAAEARFTALAGVKDPTVIGKALDEILGVVTAATDYSEQFVKFVAANVADQVATTLKLPARVKWSTINTFVNRVHGNYLASQRPTAFQGWAGQAIGLFQTYQFNLIQNLFRNVANGNNRIAYNMILAQGGIFGVQGVPGFQLMNQYIGEHSSDQTDIYKGAASVLGNPAANALLYGFASSSVVPITGSGIDLYSRGDMTPRSPVLLPTSLSEVPLISMTSKVFGNIFNAVGKISNGAPIPETMLNALAHNGLNRPLQGVAQLLEGTRTTAAGAALFEYDAWDTWNAITKVMGTKTLDEAVASSSYYRTVAYQAQDQAKLNEVGEAFRQVTRAGKFNDSVYMDFMSRYTSAGGKKENFDRWVVRNMKNSTESQISKLREQNDSPEGRYLQEVMGGDVEQTTGTFGLDMPF